MSKLTQVQINKIIALRKKGVAVTTIAKQFGIAPNAVRYHVNKHIATGVFAAPKKKKRVKLLKFKPVEVKTVAPEPTLWDRIKSFFTM